MTGSVASTVCNTWVRSRAALFVAAVLVCLEPGDAQAGLNRWTSGGPEGGLIRSLVVDPKTSGVVYAVTPGGGVFKSATGGSFWTPINNGLTSLQTGSFAIDPKTPAVLYVGTGFGGLFKSTNGGLSWTDSNNGLPFPGSTFGDSVSSIAIDPNTTTTLYVGTGSGLIFRSSNAGGSWSLSFNALAPVFALAVDPVTPSTVYAGTLDRGAFKSTNGGTSWSAINTGLPPLPGGAIIVPAVVIDRNTPATLYAATFGGGVFKSLNGGASWSPSNGGLPAVALETVTVSADPQTPSTLYLGTLAAGAFKSTNGGASWFSLETTGFPPAAFVTAVVSDPKAPATVYGGVFGTGVFKSTNGGATWSASNAGLGAAVMLALAGEIANPAALYAGVYRQKLFKSTNGGASWRASSAGITDATVNAVVVSPSPLNFVGVAATVYAGTSQHSVFLSGRGLGSAGERIIGRPGAGGVFKSTDAGASWGRVLQTDTAVQALVVDPGVPLTVYAGTLGNGVLKSTNGGLTWNAVNAGLAHDVVFSLAIDPFGVVYAGTSTSVFAGGENRVFKTTNGGATWAPTALSFPQPVVALTIPSQLPSTVYAGTWGAGAFKTVNAGASWTPVNAGLFNQAGQAGNVITVFALAADPQSPATIYAGSFDTGVFKTTNGGQSWAQSNVGLPDDSVVHALALNAAGTCLHAGTGGSVYDFATTVSNECPSPPSLVSSVLPTSRSVRVNVPATAFATIINTGTNLGAGQADVVGTNVAGDTCGINQVSPGANTFIFQPTDPATNQPVGDPNTPVDIAPGASAPWVITLNPTESACPQEVELEFKCTNTSGAQTIVGVNTLLLTASDTPVPDMIALAATPDGDGIVKIPGTAGTGAFAVATSNVGVTGQITVSGDTGGAPLPLTITLCETNPANGQCTSAVGPTVTTNISNNATPTFAVFVTASGAVAPDFANHRVFVRFKDVVPTTCNGVTAPITRGATSVAVITQ